MKQNILLTIGFFFILLAPTIAQKASIYGVVTASDGQALYYVNIGKVGCISAYPG